MTQNIIRLPDVKARTGLSRSTIYDLLHKQKFPPSIKLGARAVGWLDSEISEWVASRIALRRGNAMHP